MYVHSAILPAQTVDLIPVVIPIITAVAALAGGLGGVLLTQRAQAQQEVKKDERALRNAKIERLRNTYEQVLYAARTLGFAVAWTNNPGMAKGETPEKRDEVLTSVLDEALRDIDKARVKLVLDTEALPMLQLFDDIFVAFRGYQSRRFIQREVSNLVDDRFREDMKAQIQRVLDSIPRLEEAMRQQLEKLAAPIK